MFQKYTSLQSVSITGSILEFAETMRNGIHYAHVTTANNTVEAQAPTTGRGYLYIIYKLSNVIHIYANQFTVQTSPYIRKYYNGEWGEWMQL